MAHMSAVVKILTTWRLIAARCSAYDTVVQTACLVVRLKAVGRGLETHPFCSAFRTLATCQVEDLAPQHWRTHLEKLKPGEQRALRRRVHLPLSSGMPAGACQLLVSMGQVRALACLPCNS